MIRTCNWLFDDSMDQKDDSMSRTGTVLQPCQLSELLVDRLPQPFLGSSPTKSQVEQGPRSLMCSRKLSKSEIDHVGIMKTNSIITDFV